jgi:methyl-accepting chemotaxis protein
MKSLRNIPINRRLWIVLLLAMTMLLALSLLMLREIYTEEYAAKVGKTREVVETTMGILKHYQGLEKNRCAEP